MSPVEGKTVFQDLAFQRDARRQILRIWSYALSPQEFRAIMLVYDRTLEWGKEWEVITGRHASMGVWSKDGEECYAAPINSKRERATALLASLCKRGFLRKKQAAPSYAYSLNLDHMKSPADIQKARAPKSGSKGAPINGAGLSPKVGIQVPPKVGHKEYLKEESPKKTFPKQMRDSANHAGVSGEGKGKGENFFSHMRDDPTEMKSTAMAVRSRSRMRRATEKPNGKFERSAKTGFVPYRNALPHVWKAKHKEHFPEVGNSTEANLSWKILHQYALKWTKERGCGEFLDYLEWIFENWRALGASIFHWMRESFPLRKKKLRKCGDEDCCGEPSESGSHSRTFVRSRGFATASGLWCPRGFSGRVCLLKWTCMATNKPGTGQDTVVCGSVRGLDPEAVHDFRCNAAAARDPVSFLAALETLRTDLTLTATSISVQSTATA